MVARKPTEQRAIRMSPTVLRWKGYRLFFFSREERRPHVHVSSSEGEAKFWIIPGVELAGNHGLSTSELPRLKRLVEERRDQVLEAWNRHLGS
jgi:hypothetical protein